MTNRNYKISVACVVRYEHEILMIKEKQKDNIYIDIPAGGVEMGETLEEAVIREVKEETNVVIETPNLIGIFEYIEKERITINFLYSIDLKKKRELNAVHDEDVISVDWKNIDEIKKMLENEKVKFEHKLAIARISHYFNNDRDISNIKFVKE